MSKGWEVILPSLFLDSVFLAEAIPAQLTKAFTVSATITVSVALGHNNWQSTIKHSLHGSPNSFSTRSKALLI